MEQVKRILFVLLVAFLTINARCDNPTPEPTPTPTPIPTPTPTPDPTPTPTPEPVACIDGPSLQVTECSGPIYMYEVKRATDELGDLSGNDCNQNLRRLRDKLISYGLCAIGGEPGSDAVFIRRPDNLIEENHACYYGNGGWTGSGHGRFEGCHIEAR